MKKILSILFMACIFCTAVKAAEIKPYVATRVTYSFMNNDANQTVVDRGYTSTIVNKTLEDNTFGGRIALGTEYKVCSPFTKAYRLELEYGFNENMNNGGTYSHNINGYSIPTKFAIKSEINSLMLNGYWDINTGTKIVPYVGAGIGYVHISEKAYVSNQYDTQFAKDREDNLAWQLSTGISYELNSDVDVELGYRYINYGNVKNVETRGYYSSNSKRDYDSHEILLGMRYTF